MRKAIGARCEECPLTLSQFVPAYIPENPDFIALGEAPGGVEVVEGKPFVGQSGMLLDAAIEQAGGDPTNFMKTNVVACRPPANRTPTKTEIACCIGRLQRELDSCKATNVLALGRTAQRVLLGADASINGTLTKFKDKVILPAWHPAYVLRKPSTGAEFLALVRRMVQGPLIPNMFEYPERVWVHTVEDLEYYLNRCPDNAYVSADFETNQVRWYATLEKAPDAILMLQLLWCDQYCVIIDDAMLYDTPGTIPALQSFFNRVRTVGHNIKFDCVFAKAHLHLDIHQDFDTMLAWYVLDENLPMGLKFIASLEYGMPDYEEQTISPFLNSKSDEYSKVPPEILAKYGSMDVLVTWHLRGLLEQRLRNEGLYEFPFMEVIMPASNEFVDVEIRGFEVDVGHLTWVADELEKRMNPLIAQARAMAVDESLNLNSPHQVATVMFDTLGLPEGTVRKVGRRSTGKPVLEKLKGRHEFIGILKNYRRVAKMRSSYAVNILKQIGKDNRVHANFLIPGTEVGRLAVRNPALQTIPRPGDEVGALIRSSFVAKHGRVLLRLDYPQAELRVFAHYSKEPFLLKVYQDGRDLHTEVAIAMYGKYFTKEQRVLCKMFNFSYIYGGSEYSFAEDSGLDIMIARQFVREYNGLMPVGLKFKKTQYELLCEQGYVETVFGRRRRFPLITRMNQDDARKACVHMVCASTASDLTLLAGIELNRSGWDVVLLVHDEVIMEVDDNPETIERGKVAMVAAMKGVAEKYVDSVPWPLSVEDVEVKKRWAEPPLLH